MVKKFSIFLLVMALAFAFSSVVSAAPVTVNGLTFAEQTGAFTITGGSGIGTEGDPIVLFEDVSGLDVTMSISGLPGFGNLSGSGHATGFWLEKHVTNLTGETWNFYDHELQEILGTASS
ncbi:MAG: hypothetical protein SV375_23230, partial [Thermodesulfobacteriota bacterium]|nr:hypothetical protein [Thermodesulfobacteriota bacterium]